MYAEILAKADRWCAVDKASYLGTRTSSNRGVKNHQTSSQASPLLKLLGGSGFDDVKLIEVSVGV